MMKGLRSFLVFCGLLLGVGASAQSISVASFKLLENDLTANTAGTMERDQNGEPAALIKVVTSEQGFVFDGGMTGVVKSRQEVGEVWVYVPHGIKRITVKHPQLGVLRDYFFPIAIDKAKTYEMVLSTGRVETIVTHTVNKQFVVFNVTPVEAVVELNDEMLTVDSEGYAEKGLPFGTYNYRVSCDNYHTEAGQVTLNAQGKAKVDVTLRPNFGFIKLESSESLYGADVYIDNKKAGKLPFVSEQLSSGTYSIKVVKSMYKTYEQQVTVVDNETSALDIELTPNFADVTLTTDTEGEIWIDGSYKSNARWNGPLEIGEYSVEVRKKSHRASSEIVRITTLDKITIKLNNPTPIYGSLELTSVPSNARVTLDGKYIGETPLLLNNLLVGTHRVVIEKKGHADLSREFEIEERPNQLALSLKKVEEDVKGMYSDKEDKELATTSSSTSKNNVIQESTSSSASPYNELDNAIKMYKSSKYDGVVAVFVKYAKRGNPMAQAYLGLCYKDGKGIAKKPMAAFGWFEKSANQGDKLGQYYLGYCYEHGIGTNVNKPQALKWYEKASEDE